MRRYQIQRDCGRQRDSTDGTADFSSGGATRCRRQVPGSTGAGQEQGASRPSPLGVRQKLSSDLRPAGVIDRIVSKFRSGTAAMTEQNYARQGNENAANGRANDFNGTASSSLRRPVPAPGTSYITGKRGHANKRKITATTPRDVAQTAAIGRGIGR